MSWGVVDGRVKEGEKDGKSRLFHVMGSKDDGGDDDMNGSHQCYDPKTTVSMIASLRMIIVHSVLN